MSDEARRLTERYDREAVAYRDLWAPVLARAGAPLVKELAGVDVGIGLDVGAGVGTLLPLLREVAPGAHWTLLDRSRGMLALAPASAPRVVADAARLPVRDACADRVVMAFMLFHLDRPEDGLREARRVLRPGGKLGVITWGGELESAATRVWSDCLSAHGAPPDPAAAVRHEATGDPASLAGLLEQAGFGEVRAWTGELVAEMPADLLISMRTRMGSSKPRYDALDPPARAACLAQARARMAALEPGGFVARGRIVYAVAGAEG